MADPVKSVEAKGPGGWYESLCHNVGGPFERLFGLDKRNQALADKAEAARKALREADDAVAQMEMVEARRSPKLRALERKARRAKRKADELDRLSKRTEFRRELYFAGLDVTPDEVHVTSWTVFLLSLAVLGSVLVATLGINAFLLSPFSIMALVAVLFLPITLFVYLYNYPKWLAQRLRVQTLGRAPEAVHYMVMSMRLSPSLDRAVRFAGENVDDPLAGSLKKVLWDVYTRTYPSIEDSFMAFAEEWGHWNEDFKRSMYSIRMATLERTEEGLSKNLEKALEAILQGTKKRIEDFASGLQSPTTVLFGLGVLLPMIIGAMLPMVFLAGLGNALNNPGSITSISSSTTNPLGASPLPLDEQQAIQLGFFLVMDVLFPIVAFVYASSILGRRPGTLKPPSPPPTEGDFTPRTSALIAAAVAVVVGVLGYPAQTGALGSELANLAILFPIVGLGLGISVYFLLTALPAQLARRSLERLENEFPDALFQVGNRMAEGLPLERALERTADAMAGTETSVLFRRILHAMRVTGHTPEQVIFGGPQGPGVLALYPSRMIAVSMRALLEAVVKGPEAVGHTIVPMASYLRELRDVNDSLRISMKPTVTMMMGTAYFFSPLVLGMTGALYVLLSDVLANGLLVVSIPLFFGVLGIYLLLMVLIITYFTVGVDQGGDSTGFKVMVGWFLGMSLAIFLAAAVIGLFVVQGIG